MNFLNFAEVADTNNDPNEGLGTLLLFFGALPCVTRLKSLLLIGIPHILLLNEYYFQNGSHKNAHNSETIAATEKFCIILEMATLISSGNRQNNKSICTTAPNQVTKLPKMWKNWLFRPFLGFWIEP